VYGHIEGLVQIGEGEVMGIQGCEIEIILDRAHEVNGPLPEVLRTPGSGNIEGPPDRFSDFNRYFAADRVSDQANPGAVARDVEQCSQGLIRSRSLHTDAGAFPAREIH
jgi:hypothetical protein